ncbi:MAG: hypothetical protein Ta2D_02940 [Rickettsiales bacterium]|nr:MAG: hypothetical protein Ta2D_02940 [Rickettsiales bacterium]
MDMSNNIALAIIVASLSYYFSKRLEFKKMYREAKFKEENEKRLREENEKIRQENEIREAKIRKENEIREAKIREENEIREAKIREEMWKKQEESERRLMEEKWKKDEESSRREFLVNWITNEQIPMSSRIEAAREYLEKGYNGSTKNYIYEKGLFDNSKK